MKATAQICNCEVFGDGDCELIREAILATAVRFDKTWNTAVQPNLYFSAQWLARALALADLGSAGMDPKQFLDDGIALFQEQNPDIIAMARTPREPHGDRTERVESGHRGRMLQWLHGQIQFARGRGALFENELGDLPSMAKAAVQALFCRFDQSIAAAQERAQAWKDLDYFPLATKIGILVV